MMRIGRLTRKSDRPHPPHGLVERMASCPHCDAVQVVHVREGDGVLSLSCFWCGESGLQPFVREVE